MCTRPISGLSLLFFFSEFCFRYKRMRFWRKITFSPPHPNFSIFNSFFLLLFNALRKYGDSGNFFFNLKKHSMRFLSPHPSITSPLKKKPKISECFTFDVSLKRRVLLKQQTQQIFFYYNSMHIQDVLQEYQSECQYFTAT